MLLGIMRFTTIQILQREFSMVVCENEKRRPVACFCRKKRYADEGTYVDLALLSGMWQTNVWMIPATA